MNDVTSNESQIPKRQMERALLPSPLAMRAFHIAATVLSISMFLPCVEAEIPGMFFPLFFGLGGADLSFSFWEVHRYWAVLLLVLAAVALFGDRIVKKKFAGRLLAVVGIAAASIVGISLVRLAVQEHFTLRVGGYGMLAACTVMIASLFADKIELPRDTMFGDQLDSDRCLSCNARIPADAVRCPECGWSGDSSSDARNPLSGGDRSSSRPT